MIGKEASLTIVIFCWGLQGCAPFKLPHQSSRVAVHNRHRSHTTGPLFSTLDKLNADLGFVPPDLMIKFLRSVGGPFLSSGIAAGYEAGVISEEEMENSPLSSTVLSEDEIKEKWFEALEGEPWHVQTMGKVGASVVVGVVFALQTKMEQQATQMKWINDNAMPIILGNESVVEILGAPVQFNNTRAKYEIDRDWWVASMDVLGQSNTGFVNAYFKPSEEVKILVVEIDDYMHNLTWKMG